MFQWFQNKSTRTKTRANSRPAILSVRSGMASRDMSQSYWNLCQEGYGKNSIVYRAINVIAHNLASVAWQMPSNGGARLYKQWVKVLQKPNPSQSWSSFIETITSYLLLSGNTYIERYTCPDTGRMELYPLRPDRVAVVPGPYGIPKAFQYEVEGRKRTIPVNAETGESNILHIKFFHPHNDWYGLSPLQAAALAIDQANAMGQHNISLLNNGGRPTGALVMKQAEHSLPLTEEQREQLRQELNDAYGGTGQAGKMMVLEGDLDWREMGMSPRDMDFLTGKQMAAREVAQTFGVPPMLVGVPGDATFANYKEARFHLWEDTIIPLLQRIMAEFSTWAGMNAEGFNFDAEKISALTFRRESIWERLQKADFLTTDEKRAAVGYGPLEKATSSEPEQTTNRYGEDSNATD